MAANLSFFSNLDVQRANTQMLRLSGDGPKNNFVYKFVNHEGDRNRIKNAEKIQTSTSGKSLETIEYFELSNVTRNLNHKVKNDERMKYKDKEEANVTSDFLQNDFTKSDRTESFIENDDLAQGPDIGMVGLPSFLKSDFLNLKNNILIEAARSGNNGFLKRCLYKHQDIKEILNETGVGYTTLLMEACKNPAVKTSVVQTLVANGVDIDDVDIFRNNALQYAVYANSYSKASILINTGGNLNNTNIYGSTALHFACKNGSMMLIRLLIKNGARLDVKNIDAYTPLMYCSEMYGCFKPVSYLLKCGAKVNLSDHNGFNSLMKATINGNLVGVQILLMHKNIDILHVNNIGYMCYVYAPTDKILNCLIKHTNVHDLLKAIKHVKAKKDQEDQFYMEKRMVNAFVSKLMSLRKTITAGV